MIKRIFLALAVCSLAVLSYGGYRLLSLRASVRALEKRQAELVEKTKDYNANAILSGLSQSALNGFVYRFDERIGEARLEGAPGAKGSSHVLDLTRGHEFRLTAGELARAADGGMRFAYREGADPPHTP